METQSLYYTETSDAYFPFLNRLLSCPGMLHLCEALKKAVVISRCSDQLSLSLAVVNSVGILASILSAVSHLHGVIPQVLLLSEVPCNDCLQSVPSLTHGDSAGRDVCRWMLQIRKSTLLKCLSDICHWYDLKTEKCSQDGDSLSHSLGGCSVVPRQGNLMVSFPASSSFCCTFLNCYTRLICVKLQMCFNVTAWCAICSMNVPGSQKRLSLFSDSCKQRNCQMQHEAFKHNINATLSIYEIKVPQAFSAWVMCWLTLFTLSKVLSQLNH